MAITETTPTPTPVPTPTYTAPAPITATPVSIPVSAPAPVATPAPATVNALPITATPASPATSTIPAPVATSPAVAPAVAPKPTPPIGTTAKPTVREQTVQQQDDYMAYINGVKAGTDPVTNKVFNDLMKAQNASGQRTMDTMMQRLSASGQLGTGAGNAMLAATARDMGVSQSELASKLSQSALDRIENFNKLGLEEATRIETSENNYVQGQVAWLLAQGQYDEAQKVYNDNSERLGLPPVDLASPDSRTRFAQEDAQYTTALADLDRQYKADGDYDAYVKRWNELKNTNTAFANRAGLIPPGRSSLIAAQQAENKSNELKLSLDRVNTLLSTGNRQGAMELAKNIYEPAGPLGGLGLDPVTMAKSMSLMTPEQSAAAKYASEAIALMARNGATPAEIKAMAEGMAKQFPSSEYFNMLATSGDFAGLMADAEGTVNREKEKTHAEDILTNYRALDPTNTEALAQAKNEWMLAKSKSMTRADLLARIKNYPDLQGLVDQGREADAIKDYLDLAFDQSITLTDAESVTGAAVGDAFNSIKGQLGGKDITPSQESAVKAALTSWFNGDPEKAAPTAIELTKADPNLYLQFSDFNGNPINPKVPPVNFAEEKSFFDKVYDKDTNPITPTEFDAVFDYAMTLPDDDAVKLLSSKNSISSLRPMGALVDGGLAPEKAYSILSGTLTDTTNVADAVSALSKMSTDDLTGLAKAQKTSANFTDKQLKSIDDGADKIEIGLPQTLAGKVVLVNDVPYFVSYNPATTKSQGGVFGFLGGETKTKATLIFNPLSAGFSLFHTGVK